MQILGSEFPDAIGKILNKYLDAEYDSFEEFERDLKIQIEDSRKRGDITEACAEYLKWRFLSGKFWKFNCDAIEIQRKEGFEEGFEETKEKYKAVYEAVKDLTEEEATIFIDEMRKALYEKRNDRVVEYKEVLHEAFAGLLADISKLISKKGVTFNRNNPLCILEEKTAAIWREIFGDKYSSMDDMMKLRGQYEFIRSYIEEL